MSNVWLGMIVGVRAGAISVGMMIPMKFPDKRAALLGAFCSRFLIGLFTCTAVLPLPPVARGALIGFLVSLPDAIITKAYAPILVIGTVLGVAAGGALRIWGQV